MRILAINWQDLSNPLAGGAEVHLEEILSRVVGWGHHVTLACCGYPGSTDQEVINGIDVRRRGSRSTFNFVTPSFIKQLLGESRYDLIVEDINKIPFYLPIWTKLPHLAVIPHLFGKNIYQEVNPVIASYVYLSEKPIPRVYRNSHFLAISESTREDLVTRGIRRERIDVAECGVDHNLYTVDLSQKKFEQPTLLYLGRLKRYKSIHHMISAMPIVRKSIPHARAVIVGDGDYGKVLRHQVQKLGLESCVEFKGFVTQAEKLEYLRRSHLSIYPSPKEGWGITNIEANACGTPVVAANVPGLKDSVSPEHSGLLYEYGDIDQLAGQVVRILKDQTYFGRLCETAVGWAKRFTWDDCAQRSFASMEKTVREWGRHG